jgi:hypothetical protein
VPFVQGQLRAEPVAVTIETQCAHCGNPLHVELDSDLNFRVLETGAQPLIAVPMVDLGKIKAATIINDF